MKKNHFWQTLVLMALGIVLTGCGNTADDTASQAKAALTIEQADGTAVEIPADPQNVVVFDFGVADTIRALGKGDQIVGMVGKNAPEYIADFAQSKQQIGGSLKEPNLEAISALAPDLIIISSRQADFADQLAEIAPVIAFNPDYANYWEAITEQNQTIGKIFGEEALAADKLAALETQITAIREANETAPGKNMVLMTSAGSLSAFSSGTRYAFLIDTLGFTGVDKVAASTHGQEISFEGIRELAPDRIFIINRDAAIGDVSADSATDILNNPVIADTAAAKNKQLHSLDPNLWYLSGGGLESMQLQIDEINGLAIN